MDFSINNKDVNNLLVIGNGFDLHCKLKSKFSDYFNEKCLNLLNDFYDKINNENYSDASKILEDNTYSINFWSFSFYIQYYTKDNNYKNEKVINSSWFDVENLIYLLLTSKLKNGYKIVQYIKETYMIVKSDNIFNNLTKNIRQIPYIAFVFLQNVNSIDRLTNIYDYLYDELRKFEQSFEVYLSDEYEKNFNNYKSIFDKLIYKLLEDCGGNVDVINFNYTEIPYFSRINLQTNVHGKLLKDEIIIGIDFNKDLPMELYKFTKTYRNLHRIKSPFNLSRSINHILFYGHSLAAADFSYFYSLFDMYKLYDGNLKLTFLYSNYEENEKDNIKNQKDYIYRIFSLISSYSNLSHNENNLLHRLLLEGRIIIKEV